MIILARKNSKHRAAVIHRNCHNNGQLVMAVIGLVGQLETRPPFIGSFSDILIGIFKSPQYKYWYTQTSIACAYRQHTQNWLLVYDVLHSKCSAYAALIEHMSKKFIFNKWEIAMTSQGHVTTASLKQANKGDYRESFFICLHLKKFCASILEISHNKLWTLNSMM